MSSDSDENSRDDVELIDKELLDSYSKMIDGRLTDVLGESSDQDRSEEEE